MLDKLIVFQFVLPGRVFPVRRSIDGRTNDDWQLLVYQEVLLKFIRFKLMNTVLSDVKAIMNCYLWCDVSIMVMAFTARYCTAYAVAHAGVCLLIGLGQSVQVVNSIRHSCVASNDVSVTRDNYREGISSVHVSRLF